jgi:putative transposase
MVLTPVVEGGLSKFMLKLCTAYTMYFNTRHERSGALYEGRFKAKYVDSDQYLKYLFSYIHLNPVSEKVDREFWLEKPIVHNSSRTYERASTYLYSSLNEYLSPRAALGLIDTSVYGMYFSDEMDVRRELFDWLEYEEAVRQP